MPRNARCVAPGIAYHVTQRGTNGQRVFFSDSDRNSYLRLLAANREDAGARILAWCLMSNHIHLIVVPEHTDSLATLLRRVHGRYAQLINARKNRSGHLWQSRYFSCPMASSHLRRALAYVENNPVRAGMVERPEDYAWSSAAVHIGKARDKLRILDAEFWQEFGGAEAWRQLLMTPEELAELRLLRRCTYSGMPFGNEEFVTAMEERFGRKWRRPPLQEAGRSSPPRIAAAS